jgi:urease accessory protein
VNLATVSSHAVRGELQLRAAKAAHGPTVLMHRHAAGAFHLSKPYWDGHTLMVQWINPTAGIFAGDVLRSEITVEPEASLLVTTPSATRIHTRMTADQPPGSQRQTFTVAEHGWLELQGEWLIPQRGSAFTQHTEVNLAAGAGLFYTELLAPGRVAHGEVLEFASLEVKLRVHREGKLLLQERLQANPDRLWMLRGKLGQPLFTATSVLSLPTSLTAVAKTLRATLPNTAEVNTGLTLLNEHVLVIRATGTSSLLIKRQLSQLRHELQPHHHCFTTSLRKL